MHGDSRFVFETLGDVEAEGLSVHVVKVYKGSGDVPQLILNLGTSRSGQLHAQAALTPVKSLWYALFELRESAWMFWRRGKLLMGFEHRIVQPVASSIYRIRSPDCNSVS